MNPRDYHYDQCLPDYSGSATFRDSHNNISISAVISSSCVVLEGLRDSSDCLSAVFPVGQEGQAFSQSEFQSSFPTSLLNRDMLSNSNDRFNVNNSLGYPSEGISYGNHFFESAATEFTTPGEIVPAKSDFVHGDNQFLTEKGEALNMTIRPHNGERFFNGSTEDEVHSAITVFNHENNAITDEGFDFYNPDQVDTTDFSRNCRFGIATCSTFYPGNLHTDQHTESIFQCDLLSKTSLTSREENSTSFDNVSENVDQSSCGTTSYFTSENCIQNHSPVSSNNRMSNLQSCDRDDLNIHPDFNTLQKRLNLSPQNNTDSCSYPFSGQSKSLVPYMMDTSFNNFPLSEGIEVRKACNSPPDNGCVFQDVCRRQLFPVVKDIRRNESEYKEEAACPPNESHDDTLKRLPMRHKDTSRSDTQSASTSQNTGQNVSSECMHDDFVASCVAQGNGVENINGVDKRVCDKPNKTAGAGKSKRKHAETVESLQHHLETLEDRRKKMAPSCSSLNLLRQQSQAAEEMSEDDKSAPSAVDVDHMMCSGVTVAGFKPRAIIRKRSKTATPTDVKDIEYWQKRRKNNDSARKSRESKKEKEKNFYKRALELEYENLYLQECLSLAETELATLGHPFVPPVFGGQCYY